METLLVFQPHSLEQTKKKDQLSCFYFLGSTSPILNQISQHSSRRPIISRREEAAVKNQKKEELTITGS
jgi:hypothetical protein